MMNYRNKFLDNLTVSLKYGKDFSSVIFFKLLHLKFGGNKWSEKFSSYCSRRKEEPEIMGIMIVILLLLEMERTGC